MTLWVVEVLNAHSGEWQPVQQMPFWSYDQAHELQCWLLGMAYGKAEVRVTEYEAVPKVAPRELPEAK